MNQDKYFDDYDYRPILDRILKENSISQGELEYSRHLQELKNRAEVIRKKCKTKNYFQDIPTFDNEYSAYVAIINTPFVEEAKRDKFKVFIEKKITASFKDRIKDYIFPYTDEDKDKLNGNGLLLLQFESHEEAKLAASALNGAQIDKTHKATAVTYYDYEKIIAMKDERSDPPYVSFVNQAEWEESNLTEMLYLKTNKCISLEKVHFLKKELTKEIEIPSEKILKSEWSPQGKYLIVLEPENVKFYNQMQSEPQIDINIHATDYSFSNDERYLITFAGYPESNENIKENVFIRDLYTNEVIRGIGISKEEKFSHFKWSADSTFFGRIKKDILIVYESPKMQICLDPENKKRHPIKENVKDFHWFPNKTNIITITEKFNQKKLTETVLQFIEIPSRRYFPPSSLMDLEIISFEWHFSNTILAVLGKTVGKPKWSVRLFEFNNSNLTYRSNTSILPSEVAYYDTVVKWLGDDLFVVPKFKENNLDVLSVFPYKYNKQSLKIEPWASEKCLKNLKHSHFIPSSNGIHFLLACLDQDNRNSYGRTDLYVISDNQIHFCKNMEFGGGVEAIKWDEGGRLFSVEITRKRDCEGMKIFDCEGNIVYDVRDKTLITSVWRPRHIPLLDKTAENESILKNFAEISKLYDEEDSEFLSVIEKEKRAVEKATRDKFMTMMKKGKEKWKKETKEREEIITKGKESKVQHDFWIEEILKTEEFLQEASNTF